MTLKMQAYMEKHKIGPLFEDLMNKVLRDQPDDPLVYVLRAVYKRAGLEIPQEIRYGGMKRSTSDFGRGRSRSPEKISLSASAEGDLGNREYDKPWKSPTKRLKPKKSMDDAELSRAQRQRKDWNGDVRVKTTSFDELWDDPHISRKDSPVRKSEPTSIMKKSWAKVGLDDDDHAYSSSKYTGPRQARLDTEEALLAAENIISSRNTRTESHQKKRVPTSKNLKQSSTSHRKQLEKLLLESEKRSNDSGFADKSSDDEDEAIEMLENADDLLREGVTNIPKSGYKLSKIMRHREREPTVKLSINLFPRPEPSPSVQGDTYGELQYGNYDSDRDYRPSSGSPLGGDSEDEFESVSQVAGPRRPVWTTPDSDGESFIPRPAFSTPQPSKSKHRSNKHLSSTGPASYNVRSPGRSIESVEDFTRGAAQTWSPATYRVTSPEGQAEVRESLISARGGWTLPDDSDASLTEFSNVRSGRDPRAY